MTVTFEIASSDKHFNQILALQRKNLLTTLTPEAQTAQGFVSVQHTLPLLKKMAAELPQVIALNEGSVVGYNLAMPVSMRDDIPLMVPLFKAFEEILYQGKMLANYPLVVGGQVCVDSAFRGQGLLKRLYQETRNQVQAEFELCVTEVSLKNQLSLNAHKRMGFEVVHRVYDGTDPWEVVVWDFKN